MFPMGISPSEEIAQYVLKVLAETDQDVEFNTPSPTVDQRGRPSYFMVAVYTVLVKDTFPLPEGLQQQAGERRQLQLPEGSPLDRDDLLDQLEQELKEKLAQEAAPTDLTGDDDHQKAASADEQAPQPEGDQRQVPEGEQASADQQQQESKEGEGPDPPKDQLSDGDPWNIFPHRHDELTAALVGCEGPVLERKGG